MLFQSVCTTREQVDSSFQQLSTSENLSKTTKAMKRCSRLLLQWNQRLWMSSSPGHSVFPDRTKPPGLNDRLKLWWAKEVTPDFHVAGRLSERQIKYASEGGFKSILSLYRNQDGGNFGGEYLPTSKEAREIVEEKCGMQYVGLLSTGEEWCSIEAVNKMADVLPKLKTPVLLHSNHGCSITFILLMNLAQQSRLNMTSSLQFDSARVYEIAARMGLNFTSNKQKMVASKITGEPIITNPPECAVEPENWLEFWLAHPVYKNWYTAGQITKTHMHVLERSGFKSVINMRLGMTTNGEPSQEEVNLLNIPEKTGTYATDKTGPRQSKDRLEETRIDPSKPGSYIEPGSKRNYESVNEDEFGDAVGFNANLEEVAFERSPLTYCHLPMGVSGPFEPYFDKNLEKFVERGSSGPVLVHCARAFRAAYGAVLAAAVQYDLGLNWAVSRCRDLGYGISEDKTPEIYKTFEKYLHRK